MCLCASADKKRNLQIRLVMFCPLTVIKAAGGKDTAVFSSLRTLVCNILRFSGQLTYRREGAVETDRHCRHIIANSRCFLNICPRKMVQLEMSLVFQPAVSQNPIYFLNVEFNIGLLNLGAFKTIYVEEAFKSIRYENTI